MEEFDAKLDRSGSHPAQEQNDHFQFAHQALPEREPSSLLLRYVPVPVRRDMPLSARQPDQKAHVRNEGESSDD